MIRKISGAVTGGALGALVDSVNIWVLSQVGFTTLIGVSLAPKWTGPWIYQRMVWGGIWGLLLLLPVFKNRIVLRGILMSLAPTAMVLFKVFPAMGKGVLGLEFGLMTPVLVLLLNFIWGIVGAYWFWATCSNR